MVATGSSPALPPIPGLAETPFLTNETVFDLTERPQHLIVIGGGPIGLELAQAFRRLGAAVTVLEAAQPLAREDPECAAIVLDALAARGGGDPRPAPRCSASSRRRRPATRCAWWCVARAARRRRSSGSHLLVATGRAPMSRSSASRPPASASSAAASWSIMRLRTTNRRVYAIGDVAGGLQFTHAANYHAGLVIRNALFRLPVRVDEDTIPRVTFTDPELAQSGSTEAEARERRPAHPRAALALPRERPRPGRARDRRPHQGA